MPTRPILVRIALAVALVAALVALADGVAQHELRQAIGGTTIASAVMDAQPSGAFNE
jgi:hypothetical protein